MDLKITFKEKQLLAFLSDKETIEYNKIIKKLFLFLFQVQLNLHYYKC